MAHYAFIDASNTVTDVIVGNDEGGDTDWEAWYAAHRGQECRRTSIHMHGGAHSQGKATLRKNYAGIGYTYDRDRDAFIPPKTYPSWILNEDTCLWEAPKPRPEGRYRWDERAVDWVPDPPMPAA